MTATVDEYRHVSAAKGMIEAFSAFVRGKWYNWGNEIENSGGVRAPRSMTRLELATVPRQYTYIPLATRFASKFEVLDSGCWRWTAFLDKAGYGRIRSDGGRAGESLYAHRVSYELHIGKIPDGLVLDHLCHNRWCVNPAHLEPVSQGENVRRGDAPAMILHARGTCKNGHEVNDKNTLFRKGTGAVVYCKCCRSERLARSKHDRG